MLPWCQVSDPPEVTKSSRDEPARPDGPARSVGYALGMDRRERTHESVESQCELVMAYDARESDQERGRLKLMLRNLQGLDRSATLVQGT